MDSLAILDLSKNVFYGNLPKALAVKEHPSLRQLILSSNWLNGSLTQILPEFSKLEILDVAWNRLEGVVTDDNLLNFSCLSVLDLSFNILKLNVSPNWVPRFQLETLGLKSCQLGLSFPSWLRMHKNISSIDLAQTGIAGTVPGWFWSLSLEVEQMNLSVNSLQGNVQDLRSLSRLSSTDLSNNMFSGQLPQFARSLQTAVLSSNLFSGPMVSFCEHKLTQSPWLSRLVQQFSIRTNFPDSSTCLQDLVILNMQSNNLSGRMPDTIGDLSMLSTLILGGKWPSGEIASSMSNCFNLIVLDLANNRLSGHIPVWMDGKFHKLMILSLASNILKGNIPLQMCQLKLLQILALSDNYLSDGDFYGIALFYYQFTSYVEQLTLRIKLTELKYSGNLPFLKALHFSSNMQSGEIPWQITNLTGLFSLNLSSNNLTGAIPSGIGGMKSLEALDLSQEQLSCTIPVSISLIKLERSFFSELIAQQVVRTNPFRNSVINVRADIVPAKKTSSVGVHLKVECSEHQAYKDFGCVKESSAAETEHGLKLDPFYPAAILGFLAGFWGFCAIIALHKPWRHAHFRSIETVSDKIYVAVVVAAKRPQRKLSDQANA